MVKKEKKWAMWRYERYANDNFGKQQTPHMETETQIKEKNFQFALPYTVVFFRIMLRKKIIKCFLPLINDWCQQQKVFAKIDTEHDFNST